MTPLLSLDRLTVEIGQATPVRAASFDLAAGGIFGLVGESGSGKSLAALAIMGLLPPSARAGGRIRLAGEDLLGKEDAALCRLRGRAMGMVFQEPMSALNPVMTIGAQVAETLSIHGVNRSAALRRADEALTEVGLPADRFPRDRYPHQLSGGQRQRVGIAIAIALKPRLLIADEPTTALDVTTQAGIMALLRRLVADSGMALLLISHDLPLVASMADRIAVMRAGEIVEAGDPAVVLRHAAHPYTRRLAAADTSERTARTAPNGAPVLEVRGVTREYRAVRCGLLSKTAFFRAVDDVSLTVAPRETVAIVGESGCGKSTLLRTILGLERAQAGTVTIGGRALFGAARAETRSLRRAIQIVFQDPAASLDPRWRVGDTVAEPLSLCDPVPDRAERMRLVAAMLERVGLAADATQRFPHEFSGGQRQRIAIARALIVEPEVLVLDEPTSALDATVKAEILDLLGSLQASLGTAYLFATHDLAMVRRIADRVLVMQSGRIVEEGPTEAIFERPTHPYTAALVAATPLLETALRLRAHEERA